MTIKPGDLVVAVKGCPKCGHCAGKVFVVLRIVPTTWYQCNQCGEKFTDSFWAAIHADIAGLPVSWLKKIPPLDEIGVGTELESIPEGLDIGILLR